MPPEKQNGSKNVSELTEEAISVEDTLRSLDATMPPYTNNKVWWDFYHHVQYLYHLVECAEDGEISCTSEELAKAQATLKEAMTDHDLFWEWVTQQGLSHWGFDLSDFTDL